MISTNFILKTYYNTQYKMDKFEIHEQLIHQQSIFHLSVQFWRLERLN